MSAPAQKADRLPVSQLCATALAIAATGTSVCVSVIAAWERGGRFDERLVWAFIGVVLLLSAHLMPALSRGTSVSLRSPAMLLWLASMIATSYGHAIFFMSAQQHAGELRAASIGTSVHTIAPAASTGRTLTNIADERAHVTADLAATKARKCSNSSTCAAGSLKRASLSARLVALNIEVEEARRRQTAEDHLTAALDHEAVLRDSAMYDPVTNRVSELFTTATGNIDLVVGLSFGVLLESIGCLGWMLALNNQSPVTVEVAVSNGAMALRSKASGSNNVAVTVGREEGETGNKLNAAGNGTVSAGNSATASGNEAVETTSETVSKMASADLARLAAEIAAGRSRVTVADIRKYFRCSQSRAMALRRQFGEAMQDLARSG